MSDRFLSADDRKILLALARHSIERVVNRLPLLEIDLTQFSQILTEDGASFVTLTIHGELRGCIGALEPYQPLVQDVCEHAVAAAFDDYRFPPLRKEELAQVEIEISRLTRPVNVDYKDADDLLCKIRPGIDGIVLRDGIRRATFLPQVWEKLPDKKEFMGQLCMKMGAAPNLWQKKKLEVLVYQVEEFHE